MLFAFVVNESPSSPRAPNGFNCEGWAPTTVGRGVAMAADVIPCCRVDVTGTKPSSPASVVRNRSDGPAEGGPVSSELGGGGLVVVIVGGVVVVAPSMAVLVAVPPGVSAPAVVATPPGVSAPSAAVPRDSSNGDKDRDGDKEREPAVGWLVMGNVGSCGLSASAGGLSGSAGGMVSARLEAERSVARRVEGSSGAGGGGGRSGGIFFVGAMF